MKLRNPVWEHTPAQEVETLFGMDPLYREKWVCKVRSLPYCSITVTSIVDNTYETVFDVKVKDNRGLQPLGTFKDLDSAKVAGLNEVGKLAGLADKHFHEEFDNNDN